MALETGKGNQAQWMIGKGRQEENPLSLRPDIQRLILTRQAGLVRTLTHWNGPSSKSRLSDHNGYRLSIRESRMVTMNTSRQLASDRISTKKSGLAIVVLMLVSLLATFSPQASASEIVLTDPIEVVQSGVHNDRMMSMDADSSGNVHVVWSRNTNHLYLSLIHI